MHNTETNEVIDREMTDAEFAEFEARKADTAAKQAKDEVKANARAAILDRLGLTADEAAILLG